MGLTNGIEIVLPTLMVLVLVGKENSLGSIQAFSGVFVAFIIYHIGKRVNKDRRFIIFSIGILFSITASLTFSLYYSALGVLCYFLINALAGSFRWTIYGPLSFDVIDAEERKSSKHRYSYIFDQQLYLNLGRNFALLLFIPFFLSNHDIALRYTPLIFALPQLLVLWLIGFVEKQLIVDDIREHSARFNYVRAIYHNSKQ